MAGIRLDLCARARNGLVSSPPSSEIVRHTSFAWYLVPGDAGRVRAWTGDPPGGERPRSRCILYL